MNPDWQTADGRIALYARDCAEVAPHLNGVGAVVTDPPYGVDYNPKRSQSSAASGRRKKLDKVVGDNQDFDPSSLLSLSSRFVVWGANYFASKLPDAGGWLVWDKRDGGSLCRGFVLSDCELAWCNVGNTVRMFSHRWCGDMRDSERGKFLHPTQKPVALMAWCLEQVKVTEADLVFDPYMGSGPTAVACARLGCRFVGCEIVPEYFDTACRRVEEELSRAPLIAEPVAVQRGLLDAA